MTVRPPSRCPQRLLRTVLVVAIAGVAAAGCKEVEEETAKGYEPASTEAVKGGGDVKRVTFTAEGARRVGLRTAPVRHSGDEEVVPYAALVYDAEGRTWVYGRTGSLTFVRRRVDVDRIQGTRAFLSRGPAAGTRVVTVGAAEVYGTELDVAVSH